VHQQGATWSARTPSLYLGIGVTQRNGDVKAMQWLHWRGTVRA
jgi:hypothetical protein